MKLKNICTIFFIVMICNKTFGQTDIDAIMMSKHNFCAGAMYNQSSWKDYWEGTFKRNNGNIGTLSTSSINIMGNYGVTDKINILFNIPYVTTKASAGTLRGMKGIQDLSLMIKYMAIEKKIKNSTLSLYTIAGFSMPITNYVADFLPMSIGLRSKTGIGRIMLDYQYESWFATISYAYMYRSNIKIDRIAYYTTEMHYTNEVEIPNATNLNARAGYRTETLIAEVVVDDFVTQGGFDIRKNDMPFPSNKMNMLKVGVNAKFTFNKPAGLSLVGGGNYIIKGRNVGQSINFYGGVFYIMNWGKKKETN